MSKHVQFTEIKENQEIYWRWRKDSGKSINKSTVQSKIITEQGQEILELSDGSFWTNYPNRILFKDIEIL
jgi:hypothetical protein